MRAVVLPRGYIGINWRPLHKKTVSFSVSWGETVFSQRPIGLLPCPHGSWTFSTNWILLKTSRPMPQTDSWISSVLGRKNPLHFQQHDTELGHTNWCYRVWPWTDQQIPHETSAYGYSSDAYVPACDGGSDVQESGRDIFSDIQLLSNIFALCGQRHVGSAPPWSWMLRKNYFAS